MTPNELKDYVKTHNIKMIDAKFVDFLGQWKHLTYPIERLEEGLEEGFVEIRDRGDCCLSIDCRESHARSKERPIDSIECLDCSRQMRFQA